VKTVYRQAASEDVVRQFRYYLLTLNLPEIAVRFRDAVRGTLESLRQHPLVGPRYHLANLRLQTLRSWPVTGFENTRIYYILERETLHVVRILHGKRDVKNILEKEESP